MYCLLLENNLVDKFLAMQRFVVVAQTRSFTQAADILGLPKSSISSAIRLLEKSLNTRLFHRSTRNVTLTEDGSQYLHKVKDILAEVDALESHFQAQSGELSGTLKVDMPSRFASTVVLPNLPDWFSRYPSTQIKISCADYRVNLVKEGFDCVIRGGNLIDSDLVARPIATYRFVNCISPSYRETYGEPRSLDELSRHYLIDYSPDMTSTRSEFEYVIDGQVNYLTMPNRITVAGTDAYLSACLAGLGIAQFPEVGVREFLENGELLQVLDRYEAQDMPLSFVYPSRRLLSVRTQKFMDWVQECVDNLLKSKR